MEKQNNAIELICPTHIKSMDPIEAFRTKKTTGHISIYPSGFCKECRAYYSLKPVQAFAISDDGFPIVPIESPGALTKMRFETKNAVANKLVSQFIPEGMVPASEDYTPVYNMLTVAGKEQVQLEGWYNAQTNHFVTRQSLYVYRVMASLERAFCFSRTRFKLSLEELEALRGSNGTSKSAREFLEQEKNLCYRQTEEIPCIWEKTNKTLVQDNGNYDQESVVLKDQLYDKGKALKQWVEKSETESRIACPVHGDVLTVKKYEFTKKSGKVISMTVAFCSKCKVYYYANNIKTKKTIFNGLPLIHWTDIQSGAKRDKNVLINAPVSELVDSTFEPMTTDYRRIKNVLQIGFKRFCVLSGWLSGSRGYIIASRDEYFSQVVAQFDSVVNYQDTNFEQLPLIDLEMLRRYGQIIDGRRKGTIQKRNLSKYEQKVEQFKYLKRILTFMTDPDPNPSEFIPSRRAIPITKKDSVSIAGYMAKSSDAFFAKEDSYRAKMIPKLIDTYHLSKEAADIMSIWDFEKLRTGSTKANQYEAQALRVIRAQKEQRKSRSNYLRTRIRERLIPRVVRSKKSKDGKSQRDKQDQSHRSKRKTWK